MRLLAVEGNTVRFDGGAMFGHAPKELWARWAKADEKNRIPLACRSLLLQTDEGKNILIDAGVGAFFPKKMKERFGIEQEHLLLQNLEKLGVREEDIDLVLLTHLHFDHMGGVASAYKEGKSLFLHFPKAQFITSSLQWERAKNPKERDKASYIPELLDLLEKSGRLKLISEEETSLNGIELCFSHGHTPGLIMTIIELPSGEKVFFPNDAMPGRWWVNTAIALAYDRNAEAVLEERRELLKRFSFGKDLLFFNHDPSMAFAHLYQDEKGKILVQEAKPPVA